MKFDLRRILIAIACTWGAVLLIGYIFMASPLKDALGPWEGPVTVVMMFGFWLIGTLLVNRKDPEDKA